jgi:superfamily II DNA or RNA helicase
MQLRPYQTAAVNETLAWLQRGSPGVLLESPVGSGKTSMGMEGLRTLLAAGKTVVWFAHRAELLDQASQRATALGIPHGMLRPGHELTGHKLHIASVDTVLARMASLAPWLSKVDIAVFDEAHHIAAAGWTRIAHAMTKAQNIGLTATPFRLDGKGLGEDGHFHHVVRCPGIRDLTKQGYLAPAVVYAPKTELDLSGIKVRAGDYALNEVAEAVAKSGISVIGRRWYAKHAPGQPAVVFCSTVELAEASAEAYRAAGWLARSVDGSMSPKERAAAIQGLADGSVQVLTSCALIGEGLDIPAISVAILERPTASTSLYVQQCLDLDTEVLTQEGWKRHDEVSIGGQVAAFDMATGRIEWRPIENKVVRRRAAGEPMFAVESPHLNLVVTGGHRMVYRCRSETAKHWKIREASDLAALKGQFRLPVSGIQHAPGLPLSDDEIRFIGWHLTNGGINKRTNAITICQAEGKQENDEIKKCLDGCGLKYGVYSPQRVGEMKKYRRLVRYNISHGQPRGRDKHLRGWAHLEEYIDRDFSPALDGMDERQVGILLEAMNSGHGAHPSGLSWTKRTMDISCGANRTLADRLQSLAVRRGYRCNLGACSPALEGRLPAYTLHIKKQATAIVGGANCEAGRSRMTISEATAANDTVWCLTNSLGTLVTRRRGKVVIVGNCGRALRPHADKSQAIILDLVGNCGRHGMYDAPRPWDLKGGLKGLEKAVQATWRCRHCSRVHERPEGHIHMRCSCGNTQAVSGFASAAVESHPPIAGIQADVLIRMKFKDAVAALKTRADLVSYGRLRRMEHPVAWADNVLRTRNQYKARFSPRSGPMGRMGGMRW